MDIFAGAMKGIRNPNAHENTKIYRDDAIRKLMFASLLMYKIDDAVKFTEAKRVGEMAIKDGENKAMVRLEEYNGG